MEDSVSLHARLLLRALGEAAPDRLHPTVRAAIEPILKLLQDPVQSPPTPPASPPGSSPAAPSVFPNACAYSSAAPGTAMNHWAVLKQTTRLKRQHSSEHVSFGDGSFLRKSGTDTNTTAALCNEIARQQRQAPRRSSVSALCNHVAARAATRNEDAATRRASRWVGSGEAAPAIGQRPTSRVFTAGRERVSDSAAGGELSSRVLDSAAPSPSALGASTGTSEKAEQGAGAGDAALLSEPEELEEPSAIARMLDICLVLLYNQSLRTAIHLTALVAALLNVVVYPFQLVFEAGLPSCLHRSDPWAVAYFLLDVRFREIEPCYPSATR